MVNVRRLVKFYGDQSNRCVCEVGIVLHGFCGKFYTLSSSAKFFENRLRFDKVTDSLNMERF